MMKDMRENTARRVGQVKEVTSLANPIIKDIKALTQKKGREETGTFMAEGLKLVIDALELGWTIKTLVYAKAAKGKPLVEQAAVKTVATGGLVLEVSEKVIASITRRDNPQMVVGIFVIPAISAPLSARRMRRALQASFSWVIARIRFRWKRCAPPWVRSSPRPLPALRSKNSCPGKNRRRSASSPPIWRVRLIIERSIMPESRS